ncbi:MAG TPA: VOC family protein [Gaiellaceae bacterium]|nr:VOC family protein [Gaiellaceae bacterium]
MPKVTPFLWFDTESEQAAELYTSVFPNSRILDVTRYGSAGPREEGLAMTVSFELDGQRVVALNGGPDFKHSEAFSFTIDCDDQAEVDHYWEKLGEGGEHGPCGWLKDRFGLSWQVVPKRLPELLSDPDREKAQRVMAAMLKMRKLDVAELEQAASSA